MIALKSNAGRGFVQVIRPKAKPVHRMTPPQPFADKIRETAATVFDVPVEDMLRHRRGHGNPASTAKFAAVGVMRAMTVMATAEIARAMNYYDGSTANHALQRHIDLCDSDPIYKAKVEKVMEMVG